MKAMQGEGSCENTTVTPPGPRLLPPCAGRFAMVSSLSTIYLVARILAVDLGLA